MTTKRPDLYAILGITPHTTQAEISHAYCALLRRHHPDTRASADQSHGALSDAALQQVLAGDTMLRDPGRRADYDREVRLRSHPASQRPQQTLNKYGAHGQPPIIAGPVRWHSPPTRPHHRSLGPYVGPATRASPRLSWDHSRRHGGANLG